MKGNILYIGKRIIKPQGGADQVNLRNLQLLIDIFADGLTISEPTSDGLMNKLFLGSTRQNIEAMRKELSTGKYDYVFISQSLLGGMARAVKKEFPTVKVITFFHNIEVQYAQSYYHTKGIKALPFFLLVKYWEKVCVDNTDYFITLNSRDSALLHEVYGKSSNLELPTSLVDKYSEEDRLQNKEVKGEQIDYLFVGVAFFANVQGVQWFIDNVMPKVSGHLWVVGKGMDTVVYKNMSERIHVLGFVNDLSSYYYQAKCVVSPIFVGGGMKTKTAEALMFGKTIIGTREAFEGYERCSSMIECNTKEGFINSINSIKEMDASSFSEESRFLFSSTYSYEALFNRFINWLNTL